MDCFGVQSVDPVGRCTTSYLLAGPLCLQCLVFSLGCVYLCSLLPCTFDGWVPILDFYLKGFFKLNPRNVRFELRDPDLVYSIFRNNLDEIGGCWFTLETI